MYTHHQNFGYIQYNTIQNFGYIQYNTIQNFGLRLPIDYPGLEYLVFPNALLKIIVSLLEIIIIKRKLASDARSTLFSD